ncbi:class I SAM-dependent methyltransferase [Sphingobium boeckii]|uniref:2-polyprenyl-3-methyl-5-hydroxy-6-metoxy-1, 4-benzoquinol methylase n=1 Tax=Sphingobium boeckii TaxID=1082345 RepID=A0A7W9AHK6_9SPHN|nr:class I SAM-dependent methyltransferase [Sphingobium boeckii]MBB5685825.1 2-polyprenyl-3-methyl-5-hydroxy-6-metoxy-1,4-benzoquinol methylase [Sphingobium boeckii]
MTIDAPQADALTPAETAFTGKLIEMINHGATGLMLSVGHRTGLFEAMRDGRGMTSEQLAHRAGLNERYVREWLGAMTTAGIVSFDRDARLYTLPEAHRPFLGRGAAKGSMSSMFQFLAVLGGVESRIVECFHKGGGVSYAEFERFHECMAEESEQTVVVALDDAILPLAPGLIARLEAGIAVADIGCGIGKAMNHLAARFPNSHFTGFDLCEETILLAQLDAREQGLENVRFAAVDATGLAGDAQFDLIFTFDAVHDQAEPAAVLAHIRRLLKPGGVYLMQDIDAASDVADNMDNLLAPFTYTISCMHCMTVSLAQGGQGLGAAWGEQLALAMLKGAGFADVTTHRLPHDIQNLYYVCR